MSNGGISRVVEFGGAGQLTISTPITSYVDSRPEKMRFGMQGTLTPNTTGYLGQGTSQTTDAKVSIPVEVAATYTKIRVKTSIVASGTVTYTLYKNGAPTSITVVQVNGATTAYSADSAVDFAQGDTMSVKWVTVGDFGGSASPQVVIS